MGSGVGAWVGKSDGAGLGIQVGVFVGDSVGSRVGSVDLRIIGIGVRAGCGVVTWLYVKHVTPLPHKVVHTHRATWQINNKKGAWSGSNFLFPLSFLPVPLRGVRLGGTKSLGLTLPHRRRWTPPSQGHVPREERGRK